MTPVVLALFLAIATFVHGQAPGDGSDLCTEDSIQGFPNPFFEIRPVYSASERPLMDSRDYLRLLQENGDTYVPWQSLDRDNNNTNGVITEVRTIPLYIRICSNIKLISLSGLKL